MTAGPVPLATPLTAPYWEGAKRRELWVQQCHSCGRHYFFPRPSCRYCFSTEVGWTVTSGRASLASYIINARPMPSFRTTDPQVIALVDLEEGPRMLTNVIGVEPDPGCLKLGMALQVDFVQRGEMALPVFRPRVEVSQ
ncbi:DNA-binding protein [Paenarthrobacter nitroguajacolicus]|uniref:Zn-ribbon domain-containing OB-fold protein n=1 Tax=Paenarthrobacter nitroguajacolicus TaxID=211146 RepID=UPI0015BFDA99|nr:DNA-binding protein [Paenarthrobacter nitroguajacolicus]